MALESPTRALPSPRAVCQPLGRGAGASPAGLSAAIFPPRLEFFPAGGVALTPAAGLVAGPVGGGKTLQLKPASVASGSVLGGPRAEEVTNSLFVV